MLTPGKIIRKTERQIFLKVLMFINLFGFLLLYQSHVAASIKINSTAMISCAENSRLIIRGNWINNGGVFDAGNATIQFQGSSQDTIFNNPGAVFYNLAVDKNSGGTVYLNDDLTIVSALQFINGNLETGPNMLTLDSLAMLQGETSGRYLIGNLIISQLMGTGIANFGGIGVEIDAGIDDLGNVTVTRVSGPTGQVVINGQDGIDRRWIINSDQPPLNGRNLTLSWIGDDDNGLDLTTARVWKSEDYGSSWFPVGPTQDVSASRSITVSTTSFSDWTVNDQAASGEISQNILLIPNQFNLISLNVIPDPPDIELVMNDVNCLIIVKDHTGGAFIPPYDIDTIDQMQVEFGYQIFVTCPETLNVTGLAVNPAIYPITIQPNQYNMIAYLQQTALPITDQLAAIADQVIIVSDQFGNSWIPDWNIDTIDSTGGMQPGLGYKIFIAGNNPITFNYPSDPTLLFAESNRHPSIRKIDNKLEASNFTQEKMSSIVFNEKSAHPGKRKRYEPGAFKHSKTDITSDPIRTNCNNTRRPDVRDEHFIYTETGLPYALVITDVTLLDNGELTVGDEVGVFDGDLCVGGGVFAGSYPFSFPAWEGDANYELPGFTPGNDMVFLTWDASEQIELEMEAVYLQGDGTFGSGLFSVLALTELATSIEEIEMMPTTFSVSQNYPNPFNPSTTIGYGLPIAARVSLNIYNPAGQLVRNMINREQPAGYYQVRWDGKNQHDRPVASGVYFYLITAGPVSNPTSVSRSFAEKKRMLLLK